MSSHPPVRQHAARLDASSAPGGAEHQPRDSKVGALPHLQQTYRIALRDFVAVLPPNVNLPAGWIREFLDGELRLDAGAGGPLVFPPSEPAPLPDRPEAPGANQSPVLVAPATPTARLKPSDELLTAREFGARRQPRRGADWVRDACRAGHIAGAKKEGGEWLIPASALVEPPADTSRRTEARNEGGRRPSRRRADAMPTAPRTMAKRLDHLNQSYPAWASGGPSPSES